MSTNLALGLFNQTAGIIGENISQTLTGLSEMIGRDALNLKVNKEAAVTLSLRIKDLVAAVNEALEVQDGEVPKPAWAHALASFNRVLRDAQVALDKLQCKSHIMQLLHQKKDADMLKELSDRVSDAFGLLKLRVNIDMATNADTIHRVLDDVTKALAEIEAVPIPPSAARLPSPPPAYVGRTVETATIVEMLSGPDQAFIAVLGGPGMGKTSVAVAALHATEVETKFTTRRYFIACDAADGLSSLLTTLCTGLGIEFESPKSAQKALQSFLTKAPCLLLLDNFESVWEAASTRQETEDLLSVLASLSTVSIVITLRGSELPAGISWTRPLLPPLQPLHTDAAVQLFLSIADKANDGKELLHLLDVLDNIPLAVILMANLAQWQSILDLTVQWEEIKTAMLQRSHGSDHLTSLDVSIGLSLASPRMQAQPHAQRLLSLLALLPMGVSEADLTAWPSELVDSRRSMSVLLQTSLVYHKSNNKLCVLAPIREFMLQHYPPDPESLSVLTAHYFALPDIVVQDRFFQPATETALELIIPEIHNIYSVISWCFLQQWQIQEALLAARSMLVLYDSTGYGSLDLLGKALSVSQSLNLSTHIADLTLILANLVNRSCALGDAQSLYTRAEALYCDLDDTSGRIRATIGCQLFMSPEQRFISCLDMCALAEASGSELSMYRTYYGLAMNYSYMGQLGDARQSFSKALHALQKMGPKNHWRLGHLLYRMANIDADIGNIAHAVKQLEEAIRLLQAVRSYNILAEAQRLLAEICVCQGYMTKAQKLASDAALNSRPAGDRVLEFACCKVIITINLYLDNDESATSVWHSIQQVSHPLNHDDHTLAQLHHMQAKAAILYWQGELDTAGVVLVSALRFIQEPAAQWLVQIQPYGAALLLTSLGQVEQAQGNLHTAASCFITAVATFRHEVQYKLVPVLVYLAQVLDDDTSESLLNAVMPPLKHWNFRLSYAEALLHSANIALRRNELQTARHRARNALHYFEEINTARACKPARAFLGKCG